MTLSLFITFTVLLLFQADSRDESGKTGTSLDWNTLGLEHLWTGTPETGTPLWGVRQVNVHQ